jgi:Fe-S cluster assembly protein SufD
MTITHVDFEIPTGREESWRFTPLARLRGLEADAEFAGQVGIDWDAVDCQVQRVPSADIHYDPVDRVSSRAWADVSEVVQITIPRERAGGPSVNVRVKGLGGVASGHIRIVAEPFSSATVVLVHTGTGAFVARGLALPSLSP